MVGSPTWFSPSMASRAPTLGPDPRTPDRSAACRGAGGHGTPARSRARLSNDVQESLSNPRHSPDFCQWTPLPHATRGRLGAAERPPLGPIACSECSCSARTWSLCSLLVEHVQSRSGTARSSFGCGGPASSPSSQGHCAASVADRSPFKSMWCWNAPHSGSRGETTCLVVHRPSWHRRWQSPA